MQPLSEQNGSRKGEQSKHSHAQTTRHGGHQSTPALGQEAQQDGAAQHIAQRERAGNEHLAALKGLAQLDE